MKICQWLWNGSNGSDARQECWSNVNQEFSLGSRAVFSASSWQPKNRGMYFI